MYKDQCFLLCTDGFWHHITDAEIAASFNKNIPLNEKILKDELVAFTEKAIRRGETDNITSLIIKVTDGVEEISSPDRYDSTV